MNHDTTNNDDVFVIFLQQSCSNNRDAFLRKNRFSKIRIMMTVSYFLRFTMGGGGQKKTSRLFAQLGYICYMPRLL